MKQEISLQVQEILDSHKIELLKLDPRNFISKDALFEFIAAELPHPDDLANMVADAEPEDFASICALRTSTLLNVQNVYSSVDHAIFHDIIITADNLKDLDFEIDFIIAETITETRKTRETQETYYSYSTSTVEWAEGGVGFINKELGIAFNFLWLAKYLDNPEPEIDCRHNRLRFTGATVTSEGCELDQDQINDLIMQIADSADWKSTAKSYLRGEYEIIVALSGAAGNNNFIKV